MYIEFLLLIVDYFKTIKKRIFVYEWLLPFIISFVVLKFFSKSDLELFKNFRDSALNILGVLLGFSIAVITIITTGSGKNIDEIKSTETDIKIGGLKISLYRLTLINFTYSVILEIFLIIGSLTVPIISKALGFNEALKINFYSVLIFLVIHVLLLTLRNLSDFYLIITKK